MPASPLAPAWLSFPADTSALEEKIWSAHTRRSSSGELTVAGVGVTDLVREFGTPLFVIDEEDLRARAVAFRDAFNAAFADLCGGVDVYYASKAFLTVDVARWVTEEGLRLDTCSGGELAVARRAGVSASELGLHGNNKSIAEIEMALELGLGRIVVDSLDELERIGRVAEATGQRANIMLRLTPGVHASTHEFIATAHEDQKFGLSMVDDGDGSPAERAVAAALSHPRLNLVGLHAHIGSQIFEADGFAVAAQKMLRFMAAIADEHGVELPELDLGGGHGIAYTEADTPRPASELAEALAAVVRSTIAELPIRCPRISIEPGRAISGPAGMTVYEAGVTKTVAVEHDGGTLPRRYVSVDGGMSDNARPVLYGADYTATLASRVTETDAIISRVVGKHCESGDIVVRDVYLPEDVAAGDLIAVPATGAYCWALSSNYNYLARPAVVAVREGQTRLMIRRETEDDLLARDMGA
ncbi:diaminopimelate decarboxylase [Zhihengliuella flava]|uniref:Diaminopimelate decarboxylase n=1 Tax=Zhihengliuella flava TaxID=1285193 RepID=A0A931DB53_9MICC|nr:diaminopimelate decarboxylase [Zhihengliuella flava]MBG6083648.1 diaminopimelate decarboxylase [Zhihengliuella flava]